MLNLNELERVNPGSRVAWAATNGGRNIRYPFADGDYTISWRQTPPPPLTPASMRAAYLRAIVAPLHRSRVLWAEHYVPCLCSFCTFGDEPEPE